MFVKELFAQLQELQNQGREAVKAEDMVKADEIKAKIKVVNEQLKEAIEIAEEHGELSAKAREIELGNIQAFQMDTTDPKNVAVLKPTETIEYKNAVLDDLRGVANTKQLALIGEANNHTTGNTSTVIPKSILGAIWSQIEENHPMWNDIPRTSVQGKVTYNRNIGNDENGGWQLENEPTPTVTFEFDELELDGHEFSRSVELSFKMEAMSRADFEAHIISELARIVGKALAVAVYRGTGVRMPRGIRTAVTADAPNQVITGAVTYHTLTQLFARLKSGSLAGAVIYANNYTIWTELAGLTDDNGRPLLMMTVANGQVATIFGVPVRESAEMANGEVLLGNHVQGYRCNVHPIVGTGVERDNRNRVIAHFMHVIVDGNVLNPQAYALIVPGAGGAAEAKVKAKK